MMICDDCGNFIDDCECDEEDETSIFDDDDWCHDNDMGSQS